MTGDAPSGISIVPLYANAFVLRCHELLGIGYGRLESASLQTLEEEVKTGRLRGEMEAALDEPSRPEWATQLTVVEEQPENVREATGKRRPCIDICIKCINPRPSTSFRFEAKRLRDTHSMGKYLGTDGMLALLTGHYGDLQFSGMIGYVQTGDCAGWAVKIKERITEKPARYHAETPVVFDDLSIAICVPVFCSRHRCGTPHLPRRIAHTLLLCA